MQIIYKQAQSSTKPSVIDVTSSPNGVYVRRNIKQVQIESESEETLTRFEYQEAFLTKSEYEQFSKTLIANEVNAEDNSAEYEEFKRKLDTGVKYVNGKYYKPKWVALYSGIIKDFKDVIELYTQVGGEPAAFLSMTTNIYDVTATEEGVVAMTIKEVVELWLFLYKVKEKYFNEYKASLV